MNKSIEIMKAKGKWHPQEELKFLSKATLSQIERREKNKNDYEFYKLDDMDKRGEIDPYNPPAIWATTFQRWLLRKYGLKWLVNYFKETEFGGKTEMLIGRLKALGVSDDAEIEAAINGEEIINIKVAGVTFNNRQKALERLTYYAPEEILTVMVDEPDNPYDENAVAVKVLVKGAKESYCIGYVPKTDTAKVKPYISKFPELKIIRNGDFYVAELKLAV